MKKGMVLVACMSTALVHGMKNQLEIAFFIEQTAVHLRKGCMYDADGTVDLMVVGIVQQRKLREPNFEGFFNVGVMHQVAQNKVFIKDKDDDRSDSDTYEPYSYIGSHWEPILNRFIERKIVSKIMSNRVLSVIEPCISRGARGGPARGQWSYDAKREDGSLISLLIPDKQKVIEEASKDLAVCYKNVLHTASGEKSIAIPALGTDVGFPREEASSVAVKSIFEYIKANAHDSTKAYENIHLFVKKRSEFEWYKELLEAYVAEQK